MYRALYRKYRPGRFDEVVGQQAVTQALSNQILSDRIGHAYLFTGTRGTGKTTCAKIFAKAVNCENRQGAEPCGECPCCVGLDNGSILDVIEIDAASNNSVDDIRDLRDETAYRPSRCAYKVYIIDEVHMLSTSAFNALLKIMEEPPSHVMFILATTEIHKVPATILSRCQRFDFVRIPASAMAARLLEVAGKEGIALTNEAADLIARLADGALRDALSLLDTCAGLGVEVDEALVRRMAGVSDREYLFSLAENIGKGDVQALLEQVASLREQSIDVRRLTEELISHYRALMLAQAKPDGSLLEQLGEQERSRVLQQAANMDQRFAIEAIRRLAAAMDKMDRSPDPRIELELALFDLASPAETQNPAAAVQPKAGSLSAAPVAAATATHTVQQPPAAIQPVAAPQATPPPAVAPAAQERAEDDAPPWEAAPPPEEPPAVLQADAEPEPMPADLPVDIPAAAPKEEELPPAPPPEPEPEPEPVQPQAAAFVPPVVEDGQVVPFEPWPQVVQGMAGRNPMLFSYMKGSSAYTDGRRVLIDGGEMFLSFMRTDEQAAELIRTVVQEVTGQRYGIGPYTGAAAVVQQEDKPVVTPRQTAKKWEELGVNVDIKE